MSLAKSLTAGDGFLVDPKGEDADRQFGGHIELLLAKAALRRQMSEQAVRNAKDRCDPEACIQRYLEVFEVAKDHAARNPGGSQLVAYRSLARWAGMHSTVAAMGLMRKPVELNRNPRGDRHLDVLGGFLKVLLPRLLGGQ